MICTYFSESKLQLVYYNYYFIPFSYDSHSIHNECSPFQICMIDTIWLFIYLWPATREGTLVLVCFTWILRPSKVWTLVHVLVVSYCRIAAGSGSFLLQCGMIGLLIHSGNPLCVLQRQLLIIGWSYMKPYNI